MPETTYPLYIDNVSILIGKLRDLFNSEMNEKDARFKRGERSEFVNILGVKGELIMQHHLHATGKKFTSVDLLSPRPISEPDIICGGSRIDVKTIRSDAPDLLVNKDAHEKAGKGITHYCFVRCVKPGLASYWVYTWQDVNKWEIKNVKYSDAYYLPLNPNLSVRKGAVT